MEDPDENTGNGYGSRDDMHRVMGQGSVAARNATVYDGPGRGNPAAGQVAAGSAIRLLQWNADETWCKVIFTDSATGRELLGWLTAADIGV